MTNKEDFTEALEKSGAPFLTRCNKEGYYVQVRATRIDYDAYPFRNLNIISKFYEIKFNKKGEFVSTEEIKDE